MDSFNFFKLLIDLSLLLVFSVILFSQALFVFALLNKFSEKSTDLFQYKLKNLFFSIFIALMYIVFFVFFLYGLRVYRANNYPLDLHVPFAALQNFFTFLMSLPYTFALFYAFSSFLAFFGILFLFALFNKFFMKHVFLLHLYYNYNTGNSYGYQCDLYSIGRPMDGDLISYFFFSMLPYAVMKDLYGMNWHIDYKFSKYHLSNVVHVLYYHKLYPLFITFSPLLFIFYDCIYNNWIITSTSSYLLLYIPLMLWKKITWCIARDPCSIMKLLWNLYYKEEKGIYAMSKKAYAGLTLMLMFGLRCDIGIDPFEEDTVYANAYFELYDEKRAIYVTCDTTGILFVTITNFIQKTVDGRVVYLERNEYDKYDDFDEKIIFGEEWVLLIDKT